MFKFQKILLKPYVLCQPHSQSRPLSLGCHRFFSKISKYFFAENLIKEMLLTDLVRKFHEKVESKCFIKCFVRISGNFFFNHILRAFHIKVRRAEGELHSELQCENKWSNSKQRLIQNPVKCPRWSFFTKVFSQKLQLIND